MDQIIWLPRNQIEDKFEPKFIQMSGLKLDGIVPVLSKNYVVGKLVDIVVTESSGVGRIAFRSDEFSQKVAKDFRDGNNDKSTTIIIRVVRKIPV